MKITQQTKIDLDASFLEVIKLMPDEILLLLSMQIMLQDMLRQSGDNASKIILIMLNLTISKEVVRRNIGKIDGMEDAFLRNTEYEALVDKALQES